MVFLKLFFIMIVFICLWLGINYLLLLHAKKNADRTMLDVCIKLQQQYDAIINLFSQFHILSLENRTLVQNTKKLIAQAQEFSQENVKKVTESIFEKEPDNEYIKKYNYLLAVFTKVKDDYNKAARKLRHYVDVFPTSFFARLKGITTMDILND